MKGFFSVKELEQMHGIKWDDLVKVEPELENLLRFAQQQGGLCRKWSDVEDGLSHFTYYILLLVGFCSEHRGHPILGTGAAYDVAYWKIHNALARQVVQLALRQIRCLLG